MSAVVGDINQLAATVNMESAILHQQQVVSQTQQSDVDTFNSLLAAGSVGAINPVSVQQIVRPSSSPAVVSTLNPTSPGVTSASSTGVLYLIAAIVVFLGLKYFKVF